MRLRKITLALVACLALGAFVTNAAQAAEGEGWTIGTSENQTTGGSLLAVKERVSCNRHGTSPLVFTSTLLGSPVKLTAEGIDCLEKAGSTNAATIDNCSSCKDENGVTKAIPGHSEGVLTFTGVKVVEPKNCEVAGNELTTEPLTDRVIMDPSNPTSSSVFDKFYPETATTGFITIDFAGTLCPLLDNSGTVKGTACGEAAHTNAAGTGFEPNKTGTLTKVQTLQFDLARQKTGGCELTFNGAAAKFEGAVDNQLSGANAGKPFGSD